MSPPELEATEDSGIKFCNTTDPEVLTHHSLSGADGFEILLRKKIFSTKKVYGRCVSVKVSLLMNLVSRNSVRGTGKV